MQYNLPNLSGFLVMLIIAFFTQYYIVPDSFSIASYVCAYLNSNFNLPRLDVTFIINLFDIINSILT